MTVSSDMLKACRRLCNEVEQLRFAPPVTHVYNPLVYAARPHEAYIKTYAAQKKDVVFLGMNPGPFGMAQTGVPFGEVALVRDWLRIDCAVDKPLQEHPRRPVLGLDCPRSEVSGRRLWGAVARHFETPERFFRRHFVANYCPLVFMEASGRNRTPDKLPAREKAALFDVCDNYVRSVVAVLQPRWLIGIGAFVEARARQACAAMIEAGTLRTGRVLHPSPASPIANRDWAGTARKQLCRMGVCREET